MSSKNRHKLTAAVATLSCGLTAAGLVAQAAASPQGTAAGQAPVGGTAAATSRCSTSGLVVWLNTQGNGAAGSSYYELQLTNLSGRKCTLSGFPGVAAVGLSGHQIGASARREGSSGKTVALAGGATATATLRIVDAGNFPKSRCKQTTAAGLRVYPPGEKSSKIVPFPFAACSRTGTAYLSVGAVRKS